MRSIHNPRRLACAGLAVVASAGVLTACGDDTSSGGGHSGMTSMGSSSSTESSSTRGNAVDKAFVRQMIPHHQGAIVMANLAKESAQHAEIKSTLAPAIVKAQEAEVATLTGVAKDLGVAVAISSDEHSMGDSISGDHAADGDMAADAKTLGLTTENMGMDMSIAALEKAKPFDRAFIDAMVPHHQGAIRMARAELANGTNAELKTLAKAIVSAQEKEITEMNEWRTKWYGSASPAGGVTAG